MTQEERQLIEKHVAAWLEDGIPVEELLNIVAGVLLLHEQLKYHKSVEEVSEQLIDMFSNGSVLKARHVALFEASGNSGYLGIGVGFGNRAGHYELKPSQHFIEAYITHAGSCPKCGTDLGINCPRHGWYNLCPRCTDCHGCFAVENLPAEEFKRVCEEEEQACKIQEFYEQGRL